MDFQEWKEAVPQDFSDSSRVWIYQANRSFSPEEEQLISKTVKRFVTTWLSHGKPVKGWGKLFFDQFIVLVADELGDHVCGASVDRSVRMMKSLEDQFALQLMNRMQMGFVLNDEVKVFEMNEVENQVDQGYIHAETLFFNNSISSKESLMTDWIIPFGESFLWSRIKSSPKVI